MPLLLLTGRSLARFALLTLVVTLLPMAQAQTVRVVAPGTYLPNVHVLVRVELRDASGQVDRETWDATATLTTDQPGVTLSANEVILRNGLGATLLTISGDQDFNLTATVNGRIGNRAMTFLSNTVTNTVSGTLAGSSTTWSDVVHVVGDVTVPSGHILTVQPGTWVLIDGATSGSGGVEIVVQGGTIRSEGSAAEPISFTVHDASDANRGWGEIRLASASQNVFRHTSLTRAGRSPGVGHTGSGPVFRVQNSPLILESTSIAYNHGKVMQAESGSALLLTNSLMSRSVMGPEISGTALAAVDSWFMEMFGPDDNDGIYMHSQQAGQELSLTRCVFAHCDDEVVDCLNSRVTFRDCIMRNAADKGISQIAGMLDVQRCQIVDCDIGISVKAQGGNVSGVVRVNQTTISTKSRGVAVENKFGIVEVDLEYYITNSIIRATQTPANSVYTDYDPAEIRIVYSNVGETWPGVGNVFADPKFVDAAARNFHLQADSPCIDSGDPASALDPDGSQIDQGYYTFVVPQPVLLNAHRLSSGAFGFDLSGYTNRMYTIQWTEDFLSWNPLTNFMQLTPQTPVVDALPGLAPLRAYRARVGP